MLLQKICTLFITALLCRVSVSLATLEKRGPQYLYRCGDEFVSPETLQPTSHEACHNLRNPDPRNQNLVPYSGPTFYGFQGNLYAYPINSFRSSNSQTPSLARIVIDNSCKIQAVVYLSTNGYLACKKMTNVNWRLPITSTGWSGSASGAASGLGSGSGSDRGRGKDQAVSQTPIEQREGYQCGTHFFKMSYLQEATAQSCKNLVVSQYVTRLADIAEAQTSPFRPYFTRIRGLKSLWRFPIMPDLGNSINQNSYYQIVVGELQDKSCNLIHVLYKENDIRKYCEHRVLQLELKDLLSKVGEDRQNGIESSNSQGVWKSQIPDRTYGPRMDEPMDLGLRLNTINSPRRNMLGPLRQSFKKHNSDLTKLKLLTSDHEQKLPAFLSLNKQLKGKSPHSPQSSHSGGDDLSLSPPNTNINSPDKDSAEDSPTNIVYSPLPVHPVPDSPPREGGPQFRPSDGHVQKSSSSAFRTYVRRFQNS